MFYLRSINYSCCVFRPALGCWVHPKAGQIELFPFSAIFLIASFFFFSDEKGMVENFFSESLKGIKFTKQANKL